MSSKFFQYRILYKADKYRTRNFEPHKQKAIRKINSIFRSGNLSTFGGFSLPIIFGEAKKGG